MKTSELNPVLKKYTKMGIIAFAVIVVAVLGIFAISSMNKNTKLSTALAGVSTEAKSAAELRIALVSLDKVQMESKAFKDLTEQRTNYENKLKARLEKEQKAIEKEEADIKKSQDMLSQEALQRRVAEYQRHINEFRRELNESAHAVEVSYQNALNTLQQKHLDPIIDGVIAKKNLSLLLESRVARTGKNVAGLDITDEIVEALNKKVSSIKMEKPKGF